MILNRCVCTLIDCYIKVYSRILVEKSKYAQEYQITYKLFFVMSLAVVVVFLVSVRHCNGNTKIYYITSFSVHYKNRK